MSTTIRLTRMGRKKHPFYRLIVSDSRNRRDGAYIANLGYYNPFGEPYEVKLHEDEIIAWLKKGATTSNTARALMRNEGVLLRYDLQRQGLEKAEIDAKVAEWKAESANRDQTKANAKAKVEAEAARKLKDEEKKAAEEAAAAEAKAKAEAEAEAKAKAAEEAAAAEAAEAEKPAAEEASEDAPKAEAEAETKSDEG